MRLTIRLVFEGAELSENGGTIGKRTTSAQRGLWRLLVKLPAIRARLQLIASQTSALDDLFEAYDEATVMLDRLVRAGIEANGPMIEEYTTICADLESDIIETLLGPPFDAVR